MKLLKKILNDYDLNISINKFGTDKGDFKSYIDLFYEDYFLNLKNKKLNLLEIGFRNGASLFLWSKYFKNGYILGLDNGSDLLLKEKSYIKEWINQPNIETRICNAYSKEISKSIRKKFDIIIDDGPHNLTSQIKAIVRYFPKLKTGGSLIIEDLLKGYITCFFLYLFTPLKAEINIYNFRNHRPGRDNMLYVIKKEKNKNLNFFKRLKILIKIIFNIPRELFYKYNF